MFALHLSHCSLDEKSSLSATSPKKIEQHNTLLCFGLKAKQNTKKLKKGASKKNNIFEKIYLSLPTHQNTSRSFLTSSEVTDRAGEIWYKWGKPLQFKIKSLHVSLMECRYKKQVNL